MAIATLFTQSVDTKRLGRVGATNKKEWETNLSDVPCTIHPVETSQQSLGDGAFYKTFKLWCALGTDILIGDQIVFGSRVFTVKGVSTYDFGTNEHLRITMVEGA